MKRYTLLPGGGLKEWSCGEWVQYDDVEPAMQLARGAVEESARLLRNADRLLAEARNIAERLAEYLDAGELAECLGEDHTSLPWETP